jgi:predicted TIM-barrel fold metal-dependent hydrolase
MTYEATVRRRRCPSRRAAVTIEGSIDRVLDVNGGPDLLPANVARLARLVPKLRIVINHAANPRIDRKANLERWQTGMRAAAAETNVYCKVSALVEGTRRTKGDAPTELAYYRPMLDTLWAAFGKNRLIYGSNWPVCENAASYATVHGIAEAYFREPGKAAAEKFFRKNAVAVYKLVDADNAGGSASMLGFGHFGVFCVANSFTRAIGLQWTFRRRKSHGGGATGLFVAIH